MTPASARTLATVRADLDRLVRYDDESIVHEHWIRQRYDLGAAASYAPGADGRGADRLARSRARRRRAARRGAVQLGQHPARV